MSQTDFLRRLVERLDAAGIPYMLTGSLGSSFHGEPRSTHDLDVVIDPTPEQLESLLAGLEDDRYYVVPETAREALRERSTFNIIDLATGWKADLIVRRERPFSREEFARRRPVSLLGVESFVLSPEDAVLSKLEWARAGASERQLRDVLGILRAQGATLDQEYLRRWARELGVLEELEKLLSQAAGPD